MQVGDLVKVKDCFGDAEWNGDFPCTCFFCVADSSRIGLIKSFGPMNMYIVQFDCGEWSFDKFEFARKEVEVISEASSS
jgi:hypothetical protein